MHVVSNEGFPRKIVELRHDSPNMIQECDHVSVRQRSPNCECPQYNIHDIPKEDLCTGCHFTEALRRPMEDCVYPTGYNETETKRIYYTDDQIRCWFWQHEDKPDRASIRLPEVLRLKIEGQEAELGWERMYNPHTKGFGLLNMQYADERAHKALHAPEPSSIEEADFRDLPGVYKERLEDQM